MRSLNCPRPMTRHGAAMIDLVITVLVMGILAAVAAPRFSRAVGNLRAESVALRIASDLNFARKTAIHTSKETAVAFVRTPDSYTMTNVVHPAFPAQSYQVSLSEIDDSAAFTAVSLDGSSTITFNVYGRPLVAGVALVNGTIDVAVLGETRTVSIDPQTGEAYVP